jgi:hypothetical protein
VPVILQWFFGKGALNVLEAHEPYEVAMMDLHGSPLPSHYRRVERSPTVSHGSLLGNCLFCHKSMSTCILHANSALPWFARAWTRECASWRWMAGSRAHLAGRRRAMLQIQLDKHANVLAISIQQHRGAAKGKYSPVNERGRARQQQGTADFRPGQASPAVR